MAPFNRSYTTFYWSDSKIQLYLVPFLSYLTLNNIVTRDLEIWFRDHSRPFKLVPFESLSAVSYSPSIVCLHSLSCIISEIKRDIDQKSYFFLTHLHWTPPLGGLRRNIAIPFGTEKTRMVGLGLTVKKIEDMFNSVHRIPADVTDRLSCNAIDSAMHTRRAVKTLVSHLP